MKRQEVEMHTHLKRAQVFVTINLFAQAGFIFWRDPEGLAPDSFKPETKIQMEHLILPFSILCVGLLLALVVFAIEICKYKY